MNRSSYKIHIIGGGISGLIAAKTLEEAGYDPVVIDSSDRVGGRVKTDIVENYQLDHGFQVLLESYPFAKKYLDYDNLKLQKLKPGAVIFKHGKANTIGDPLRDLGFLFPTLFSSIGNISDKLKILRLNANLKKTSIKSIFESESFLTIDYLKGKGFSNGIISDFFRPFFSGIFLEPDLQTSSRMFEFVYKMFGKGMAVLPKEGIEAISKQLKNQLTKTKFIFDKEVKKVNDKSIDLSDGTVIDTHFTIIATTVDGLVSNLKDQSIKWKSCFNLYFEVDSKSIKKPIIGLIADKDALINNIFFCNSTETETKGNHELLSVTIVKSHHLNETDLIKSVTNQLKVHCNIEVKNFIKLYHIKKALPDLNSLQYDISPTESQLKPTIYLAGDHLLNGSLNAAMISGERAAQGVIMSLEDGIKLNQVTSEYI